MSPGMMTDWMPLAEETPVRKSTLSTPSRSVALPASRMMLHLCERVVCAACAARRAGGRREGQGAGGMGVRDWTCELIRALQKKPQSCAAWWRAEAASRAWHADVLLPPPRPTPPQL